MTSYPNLAINILSGKLRTNARKWRILLIISVIAFLLLPYPINKLLGDSVLFKVIAGVVIASFLLSIAVFKHMNKYEVIGRLILDTNGISIKSQNDRKHIDIKSVNELYLKYSGYWEQVYFIGGPKIATKNGNGNFLLINSPDESSTYELFIESKAMLNRLLKYLEYYQDKGIKTTIEQI
jgi:hypothetical protein